MEQLDNGGGSGGKQHAFVREEWQCQQVTGSNCKVSRRHSKNRQQNNKFKLLEKAIIH
jgi:hypothetical protein